MNAVQVEVRVPTEFAATAVPEEWPRPRLFPRPELLDRPVDVLPGVGPAVQKKLAKLGLERVGDLLTHRPFRYEEPADEKRISELAIDQEAVIDVEIERFSTRPTRRRLTVQTAVCSDDGEKVAAVWFNQPWLEKQLRPGMRVRLRGRLQGRGDFLVKTFDVGERSATADFAPVYPASEEITPKKLRELIGAALPRTTLDALPAELKQHERLPERTDALWTLHRPRSLAEAERARARLAFDELLLLQVGLALRRREREAEVAPALGEAGELVARYRGALPFRLTEHQERAIAEIDDDLRRSVPMQRLLQGDVGSGKTVVALYAILRAVEAGRQGALMAPTETLAEQHFLTVDELLRGLGVGCVLLTSALPAKQHAPARAAIASGEA